MNWILSACVRRDSKTPLIPSPGNPKITSTPQSIRVSTKTSAAVMTDFSPKGVDAHEIPVDGRSPWTRVIEVDAASYRPTGYARRLLPIQFSSYSSDVYSAG